MAMSEPPILKLVMEKGPRAGETLEFRPDSVVRIGRVIRGNTKGYRNNLVIKDGGVSTEHLAIHFDSGKWVVQDRGSSNGTVLNGSNLTPNTPCDLRHRDIVKIGELTSISVLIGDGGGGGGEATSRRTTRQHMKADSAGVADDQGSNGGVSKEGDVRIDEASAVVDVADRPRRGRPPKYQGLKSQGVEKIVDSNPVVKVSPRRTRGKKNERGCVVSDLVPSKAAEETSLDLEVVNEGKKGRAATRRGKKKLLEDPPLNNAPISVADSKVNQQISNSEPFDGTGVGGNMENVDGLPEVPGSSLGEGSVASAKKAEGSNLGEEARNEVPADEANAEGSNSGEETRVDEGNANLREGDVAPDEDNVDGLNLGEENPKGAVSVTCSKVSEETSSKEPDLETMTLGEWFDYLEVHLPKQITDETEELIENMRHKAIRVHEYRLQQAKRKESVG